MLTSRNNPIVWGTASDPRVLSDEEIKTFSEAGFLLLDPEKLGVTPLSLKTTREECLNLRMEGKSAGQYVNEPDSSIVRSIYSIHKLSPATQELILNQFVVKAARQILASDVYIHQSHANFKTALYGGHFFWHRDFSFFHHADGMPEMRCLATMYFIDDVVHENRPLMVTPGSHKRVSAFNGALELRSGSQGLLHDKQNNGAKKGLLTPGEIGLLAKNGGIQSVIGRSGCVLIYDVNLAHASGMNLSPFDRLAVLAFYNSCENTLIEPSRPDYVAERDFRPI